MLFANTPFAERISKKRLEGNEDGGSLRWTVQLVKVEPKQRLWHKKKNETQTKGRDFLCCPSCRQRNRSHKKAYKSGRGLNGRSCQWRNHVHNEKREKTTTHSWAIWHVLFTRISWPEREIFSRFKGERARAPSRGGDRFTRPAFLPLLGRRRCCQASSRHRKEQNPGIGLTYTAYMHTLTQRKLSQQTRKKGPLFHFWRIRVPCRSYGDDRLVECG